MGSHTPKSVNYILVSNPRTMLLFRVVRVRLTQERTMKISPHSKGERMIFLDHSRRPTTTGAIGLRTAHSTIIPAWNEELICGLQDMVVFTCLHCRYAYSADLIGPYFP